MAAAGIGVVGPRGRPRALEDPRDASDAEGGLILAATLSCAFNLWFVIQPAYLVIAGRYSLATALGSTLAGVPALGATAPVFGHVSDKFGRRPLLLGGTSLLVAV